MEHDANEIWSNQLGVAVEAMQKAGAEAEDIAAIGITNQRETAIVWDKNTGELFIMPLSGNAEEHPSIATS